MIFLIHGKKQHGKDTVGKMLAYCYDAYRFYSNSKNWKGFSYGEYNSALSMRLPYVTDACNSFAEPIKQIVCILTGCDRKDLENEEFKNSLSSYKITWGDIEFNEDGLSSNVVYKEKYLTFRELMVRIGDQQRADNKYIYSEILCRNIETDVENEEDIFITDWRHSDELEYVNNTYSNKTSIIKIKVVDPRKKDYSNISNHKTEIDLDNYDDFDYTILNDNTKEDLFSKVVEIYKMVVKYE